MAKGHDPRELSTVRHAKAGMRERQGAWERTSSSRHELPFLERSISLSICPMVPNLELKEERGKGMLGWPHVSEGEDERSHGPCRAGGFRN